MSSTSKIVQNENFKMLQQGAEAKIYTCTYLGRPTVVKERFVKNYRHKELDFAIAQNRMKNEARSIARCKNVGVRTPMLYLVDIERRRIYMEYFPQSITVKDFFINIVRKHIGDNNVDITDVVNNVTLMIGEVIREMHDYNVIHGDLTTSNLLLVPSSPVEEVNWVDVKKLELVVIDFGLSHVDSSTEDKGVDLYVLERALISTHNDFPSLFDQIMQGYTSRSKKDVAEILSKFEEVRARGRKRTMVG